MTDAEIFHAIRLMEQGQSNGAIALDVPGATGEQINEIRNEMEIQAPRNEFEEYHVSDATHYLNCEYHRRGKKQVYRVKCLKLKALPNGRIKIIAFGDKLCTNSYNIKRLRYVTGTRLTKIRRG